MAGHIKFVVSVEHLKGVEKENRKPFYTRVIGIYDNLDDAIDKYIELTTKDQQWAINPTKSEIQEVINDIKEDKDFFDKPDNFYQFMHEEIYDWPNFYVGPGRYTIEKRRLN